MSELTLDNLHYDHETLRDMLDRMGAGDGKPSDAARIKKLLSRLFYEREVLHQSTQAFVMQVDSAMLSWDGE